MSTTTNPLISTTEMTLPEVANFLRGWAELTSNGSKNWDSYEHICKDMLNAAFDHGNQMAYQEIKEDKKNV